jgi:acyl-coenzyme A synthetase/AMP-(fatty) acid ligase
LWGALFFGGALVVVPFDVSRTPDSFYRLLIEHGVTVLNQTPSAFRQLMRAEQAVPPTGALALRWVIFGGEALDFKSLQPWFARHGDQHPRLVNMYGITETTVHVTYRPVSAADVGGASVIGVPIPDLQLHLLDEQFRPVAAGVAGELFVGGAGVARGYLNRPELTAQRFIPDVFTPNSDGRLYRTGDSARYLPNGDLEYLGRIDQQVKIRGFRIELGEISAAITAQGSVADSVVVVRESGPGEKVLVAYLVRRPSAEVDLAALRQSLRQRLPEYMMPAAFVYIDKLPLTVNGKLDVNALPPPAAPEQPRMAPVASTGSALESDIAAIWRDVLAIPTPGLDQNFFDVGGNSMNLVEVHARMQVLLARDFSITELFAHATVRALAAHFAPTTVATGTPNAAAQRAQRQRQALSAQRTTRRRP